MHQAKLNYAFRKLPDIFFELPEINIIDYGCGQALGTMCYSDFLRGKGYSQKVKNITLIEPSEVCLKRAALHASVFYPDAEIKTVNKEFDDLTQEDIRCSEEIATLHILSNVLDMKSFDLPMFSNLIKGNLKGFNQFVCVGPYFKDYQRDNRMKEFSSCLCDGAYYEIKDKREFYPDKDWTCVVSLFSIGEIIEVLNSKVSKEDLENAEKDEFGVLYSKDGKRLLRCENKTLKSYAVKEGTRVICDRAFAFCKTIEDIRIGNSICVIGDYAFNVCSSLYHVIIPKTLLSMGFNPFCLCGKIDIKSNSSRFVVVNNFLIDKTNNYLVAYFGNAERVSIPNYIKTIGRNSFCNNESLKQIEISDGIETIEEYAFSRCKSLQKMIIPSSITAIEEGAFEECENVQTIIIPESVRTLERFLFKGCKALQNISIPKTITHIGDDAFRGCCSLKQLTIPFSVSDIGSGAFNNCIELELIVQSPRYVVKDAMLIDKDKSELVSFFGGSTTVTIPDYVICIGKESFSKSGLLNQVYIPNTVTTIGDGAFYGCESLTCIDIPSSVLSIGYYAFCFCSSLQQVRILNPMITIEPGVFCMSAFWGCDSLERVVIPANSLDRFKCILDQSEWNKLYEDQLATIVSEEDLITAIIDEHGVLYSQDGQRLLGCSNRNIKEYKVNNGTMVICDAAFGGCRELQKIELPREVMAIGDTAFKNCVSLQAIDIPDAVSSIETETFSSCDSLESIRLPKCLKSIGERAFYSCRKLSNLVVPDGVLSIAESAFYQCDSLSNIVLPNSVLSIGSRAFYSCKSLKKVELPNKIKVIENATFCGCTSLSEVAIPYGVTHIKSNAFGDCHSLKQVDIPDSVLSFGEFVFSRCYLLSEITIPQSLQSIPDAPIIDSKYTIIKSNSPRFITLSFSLIDIQEKRLVECFSPLTIITLPDIITSIGRMAFMCLNNISSVRVPNGTTVICAMAFSRCTSLTQIELPETLLSIEGGAFDYCESLQSLVIPKSVQTIGENPFVKCNNIKMESYSDRYFVDDKMLVDAHDDGLVSYFGSSSRVFLPDYIRIIKESAFSRCNLLQEVIIPKSVVSINKRAFHNCSSMRKIIIPQSVTTIDSSCFSGCYQLAEIAFLNPSIMLEKNVFGLISNLKHIFIPKGSLERFKEMIEKSWWNKLIEQ